VAGFGVSGDESPVLLSQCYSSYFNVFQVIINTQIDLHAWKSRNTICKYFFCTSRYFRGDTCSYAGIICFVKCTLDMLT
jgi:hypothetical protein